MASSSPGSRPSASPRRPLYEVWKRGFDLLASALALVILSPLFAVLAVLIRATSRGPVFFRQWRAGRGGRPFLLLKFRSMREDAELRRREMEHLNEMEGPIFKIRNDPRITRLGRFLRRSSLDELPQLVNVLLGHMSLVGPRPLPVDQARRLSERQQRRHLVRPGLTGLWQVSGRNNLPFERMMELDLEYVARRSPGLDLRILLATVPAVLAGRGAF